MGLTCYMQCSRTGSSTFGQSFLAALGICGTVLSTEIDLLLNVALKQHQVQKEAWKKVSGVKPFPNRRNTTIEMILFILKAQKERSQRNKKKSISYMLNTPDSVRPQSRQTCWFTVALHRFLHEVSVGWGRFQLQKVQKVLQTYKLQTQQSSVTVQIWHSRTPNLRRSW